MVIDRKGKNVHTKSKETDIMDLIITLIAKENMPIRIVESAHFNNLLQGKWKLQSFLMFDNFFCCVFLMDCKSKNGNPNN